MTFKREYAKRWLFGMALVATPYAALWFVTEVYGVPMVRGVATQAVRELASNADTSTTDRQGARPVQWCSAGAYGPLAVHAEFHWQNELESGDGKNLYLWCFGRTLLIHETRHTIP
jgi:hypothetical protein